MKIIQCPAPVLTQMVDIGLETVGECHQDHGHAGILLTLHVQLLAVEPDGGEVGNATGVLRPEGFDEIHVDVGADVVPAGAELETLTP